MVLTCPVWIARTPQHGDNTGHTRRNILRTSALLALAGTTPTLTGCDLFDRTPDPGPVPDPLAPLLAGTLELAAQYRAAAAAQPQLAGRLTPIAETHDAHARELARVIGATSPTGNPGTTASAGAGSASTLTDLREAEQRGRDAAVAACLAAPPHRVALLGSIAAARSCHLEVLT